MQIELYTFDNGNDCPETYTTFKAQEAEKHARQHGLRCIAQIFEYSDSELVWDFTNKTVLHA